MRRWTLGPGRTLYRDGKAIFELSRVNLGHGLYATTSWEADDIAYSIVAFLNRPAPTSTETDG